MSGQKERQTTSLNLSKIHPSNLILRGMEINNRQNTHLLTL